MKLVAISGVLLSVVGAWPAAAPSASGTFVEAHTPEGFVEPYLVNGQPAMTGRGAVLAWRVDAGQVDGVNVAGLGVVAVVAVDAHLSADEVDGGETDTRTALFVDERATAPQRKALIKLARKLSHTMTDDVVEVMSAPVAFTADRCDVRVVAGPLRLTVSLERAGPSAWSHTSGKSRGTAWMVGNRQAGFYGPFAY